MIIWIYNNEYNSDYTFADNDDDNAFDDKRNIIPTTVLHVQMIITTRFLLVNVRIHWIPYSSD